MDYPEGARVLNVSIDLGVHGRDAGPRPPVEAYFRVIDEPVLRLASVDLDAAADVTLTRRGLRLRPRLPRPAQGRRDRRRASSRRASKGRGRTSGRAARALVGPGRGIEIVSNVNDIPKGSRLAVSTNLLAGADRRLHARHRPGQVTRPATLSEAGAPAGRGPRHPRRMARRLRRRLAGFRRRLAGHQADRGRWPRGGRPRVRRQPRPAAAATTRVLGPRSRLADAPGRSSQDSLVLVHGGMAQNVGPILEMVTEKYLLRAERGVDTRRQEALGIFDEIARGPEAAATSPALGAATTRNFVGPDPDDHPVGAATSTPRR